MYSIFHILQGNEEVTCGPGPVVTMCSPLPPMQYFCLDIICIRLNTHLESDMKMTGAGIDLNFIFTKHF